MAITPQIAGQSGVCHLLLTRMSSDRCIVQVGVPPRSILDQWHAQPHGSLFSFRLSWTEFFSTPTDIPLRYPLITWWGKTVRWKLKMTSQLHEGPGLKRRAGACDLKLDKSQLAWNFGLQLFPSESHTNRASLCRPRPRNSFSHHHQHSLSIPTPFLSRASSLRNHLRLRHIVRHTVPRNVSDRRREHILGTATWATEIYL